MITIEFVLICLVVFAVGYGLLLYYLSKKDQIKYEKELDLISELQNKAAKISSLEEAEEINKLHEELGDKLKDKRNTFSYAWLGGYIQGRTHALQKIKKESENEI